MTPRVIDHTEQSRYELLVDDELAGIVTYALDGDQLSLFHAEVFDAFLHQGLATVMVREVLNDARRRGLGVLPFCPFALTYISEHLDDSLDLVPEDQRGRFGLPR
jgi:predicted GNAT family acetyltransferase